MASQYALPQKQPMTPGTPPVSPSSRAAHAMLDQTLGALVQKMAPQFAGMVPADKAKMPLREVLKTANFMEKSLIMSKMGAYLPKGVTPADVEKAVNEPPPPPEAPAAAPGAPPGAPPTAAAQAPPAPAPAPAAPPAAAKQYALPQSPAATRGPNVTAAAAMPQGGNPALDYIARYGGHSSILQNGKITPVAPGAGGNGAIHPEFAARLAAAGQAYQKETGKAPAYGEMSRGNDVQNVYWEDSAHGTKYAAASPGHSMHQKGLATDLPDSGFRKWLVGGNMDRFGLHFPVKNDAPHIQMNAAYKGPAFAGNSALASAATTAAAAPTSAGADPASHAAGEARAAELTKAVNAPPGSASAAAPAAAASAKYFPPGTAPETIAAVNQLAAQKGLSPAAIAGVIKMESNWDQNATSPGGKYKGLTQVGPATFAEAGGKLAGMTYDQYLKATPAQQVDAYGAWLDHYKFADKAKAAGIDFSKMSPAQQAAHLQAFQFSPAVATWQGADPSRPVTKAAQAPVLGSTSLNDMTRYYEKALGKIDSGTPDPGHPDIGPVAGPPNSSDIGQAFGGGGKPSMPDPAAPAAPAAPDTGTPDAAVASAAPAAASAAPFSMAGLGGGDAKSGGGMDGIGDIFSGLGDAFGKGPAAQNAARPSGPSTIPMPQRPIPQGPVPMVDPRMIENQRQMLAQAMQRLNSGKLV